jgi:RNA polymerase sigma factor (sigma-70 family)
MSTSPPTPARLCAPPEPAGPHPPSPSDRELVALVRAARAGDDVAWTRLCERFAPTLRHVVRPYRLQHSDVDDVLQSVWLRLFKHIEQLRDPNAIAGWLVTTTRRECLRLLARPAREHLTDDPNLGDRVDDDGPETQLIAAHRRAVLGRALATLPERHRQVMTVIAAEPDADYRHISTTLSMPHGSIGPIRARSLARLQRHPELRTLRSNAA